MSVTPQQPVAGQGTAATYRVRLTNTGNVTERFTLTANLPAGISVVFSQDEVEVPPGLDNYREVSVTLQAATGSVPGSQPFTLAATATTTPNLSDQVTRTVQISRYGVAVDITPTSGVPLSPYQVTVRNTGQVQDTFTLALGGPAAPAASLASTALTLEAGASQTIPLEVGAIDFAYPGQMDLSVVATSQSDPAVQNTATTRLTIATSDQMEATITPAVVNLTAPGQGTFLVLVQNTGNRESAYQARISALNGNDTTATLTGLDDQPTQVIDSFRLPGLATGAIALNVAKTSPGTGSVTVTVTNLNQATVQDAATATLQIANQAPVADAGADRTLLVGQEITLDGSDSHDPDHGPQPLTYTNSVNILL